MSCDTLIFLKITYFSMDLNLMLLNGYVIDVEVIPAKIPEIN